MGSRLAMFNLILMEFGDFAMERRVLKGIKAKAERGRKGRVWQRAAAL